MKRPRVDDGRENPAKKSKQATGSKPARKGIGTKQQKKAPPARRSGRSKAAVGSEEEVEEEEEEESHQVSKDLGVS